MTRAADLGLDADGHGEGLAEAIVEAFGDVAGELQVLALVVARRGLPRCHRARCRRPSGPGR